MKYFLQALMILGLGIVCLPALSDNYITYNNFIYACPQTCTNANASKTLDDTKIKALLQKYASSQIYPGYSFDLKEPNQKFPEHRIPARPWRVGVMQLRVGHNGDGKDFVLQTEKEAKQFCEDLLGTVILPPSVTPVFLYSKLESNESNTQSNVNVNANVISIGYATIDKVTGQEHIKHHFCENQWAWKPQPWE
jgi:hypothetical protein